MRLSRPDARSNASLLLWLALLTFVGCLGGQAIAKTTAHKTAASKTIHLVQSVIVLNGPWKFRTGDDPAWADPTFKDTAWESVDLTPTVGAHNAAVGVKGDAPGWRARGHKGYAGFAWYRLRVPLISTGPTPLAVAGPTIVDGVYQLFVDGKLLGGTGEFREGAEPTVRVDQPRLFPLPLAPTIATGAAKAKTKAKRRSVIVALRVWTPAAMAAGEGGGLRVAPVIGRLDEVRAIYLGQCLKAFEGYVVDAVEPVGFLVLACMAVGLIFARPANMAYPWLCAALVLTAASRANQVWFFWMQVESLHTYDVLRQVILAPLALASWIYAWRLWLDGKAANWITPVLIIVLAGVTGLYMAVALGALPWFEPDSPSHGLFSHAVLVLRLVLAALYILVLGEGLGRNRTWAGVGAALTALLVAIGLFADELTRIGLKEIWLPFGVGVSRTQCAYAALIPALFALILERFVCLTHEIPAPVAPPDLWGRPPQPAEAKPEPPPPQRGGRRPPMDFGRT
ncbi:MAG TPA: hypothetical protein VIJ59_09565 [Caulobacteraceae bacterium]